jgi:DNA-nicking Smr family endonuclease
MTRRLLAEERSLWNRVIETVKPLHPVKVASKQEKEQKPRPFRGGVGVGSVSTAQGPRHPTPDPSPKGEGRHGLDSHWDRRFQKGAIIPDISIDLHGQGLASAHARLDRALDQAVHQKLRVILLVTGKARAHDRTSGQGRGAIAAVVRDWLAASRHSAHIAAVRQAHPRHGGDGALYIVLKR